MVDARQAAIKQDKEQVSEKTDAYNKAGKNYQNELADYNKRVTDKREDYQKEINSWKELYELDLKNQEANQNCIDDQSNRISEYQKDIDAGCPKQAANNQKLIDIYQESIASNEKYTAYYQKQIADYQKQVDAKQKEIDSYQKEIDKYLEGYNNKAALIAEAEKERDEIHQRNLQKYYSMHGTQEEIHNAAVQMLNDDKDANIKILELKNDNFYGIYKGTFELDKKFLEQDKQQIPQLQQHLQQLQQQIQQTQQEIDQLQQVPLKEQVQQEIKKAQALKADYQKMLESDIQTANGNKEQMDKYQKLLDNVENEMSYWYKFVQSSADNLNSAKSNLQHWQDQLTRDQAKLKTEQERLGQLSQHTAVKLVVQYLNIQGQVISTQTFTGKAGDPVAASSVHAPAGYQFDPSDDSWQHWQLSDQDNTIQIYVTPTSSIPDTPVTHPVDLSQNAGALDSYSAQNGKLHLAGWHVSSASADYQYPYIIVLDNGREVGRAQAQLVDRPDVDRLYPNTNGRQAAGFTADVDIPTYAYGDRLTVIARFSNDPAGNGQYQDYYFNNLNPVTDLNANKANLDGYHLSTNSRNGDIQLNVAGWHAAGRSVTETNHWLILFDNTTNSEIQRVKLSDADNYVVSRPDVARAFPGIANSGQSGFDGTFTLSRAELGHNLSVIARYSDDAVNGEGNRTDCWLAVPRLVNSQVNAGWVDNYHAERGTNGTGIDLVVSGWHVAGNSLSQPYHWVILYDNDTHQEVVRMPIKGQASDFYGNSHFATQPIQRPDVARQYQNVLDSNRSGFEARFALLPSTSQHSLSIISRYSDDAVNGEGNRTDYWMPAMRLDQGNHGNLDNISISGNQLHVSGWHATNQLSADEHVVILYDATQHRELSRQIVGRLARPDVAKAFPTVYNAADSGFSAAFDFQPEMAHDQIQIISRWTSAGNENSDYIDYWFAPQLLVSDQSNRANLDAFNLSNDRLTATGWHASNQALGKQYHYVILFDQTAGHELSRVEATPVQRPDVARAFPTILNAGDSGFNVSFAFDPAQLDRHRLAIISRWTDDLAGNGNATDYWFAPRTFTTAQPTSRAVRGTGDGVGALDKWAVYINPALGYGNPNRICFFTSGWHASNAAAGRPYHDIMLIDNTTGQQVGGATYANPMLPARDTSRPDIAHLYGNQYQNAGESGFKIALQTPQFAFGHRYTLVSRYATDEHGNNAVQQSYYLGQINQDMVNYGDGRDFFN